jgi:hypothetical protein
LRLIHPVFQGPLKIDVDWHKTDSPEHYVGATSPNYPEPIGAKIKVSDIQTGKAPAPGPIVINFGFLDDIPGLELIGEGISSVAPGSVAIGIQGRFLFWGFHDAPDKMTEWGQRLLVNCVYYMHSKRNDLTVPFHSQSRGMLVGYLEQAQRVKSQTQNFLKAMPKMLVSGLQKDWDPTVAFSQAWLRENRDYLYAAKLDAQTGFFDIDQDAKRLRTPNYKLESLKKWIDLAGSVGQDRDSAKNCLNRHVDDSIKPADDNWQAWWKREKDRIVFVDTVGYKFIENPVLLEKEGRHQGGLYR